jgi:hypothetical protein
MYWIIGVVVFIAVVYIAKADTTSGGGGSKKY